MLGGGQVVGDDGVHAVIQGAAGDEGDGRGSTSGRTQKIQEKSDVYLKLTRHNGRAGTHGTYNPKHNDRSFNLSNSEHIDPERAKGNIYWDCFHGFRSALAPQDPDNLAATFSDDVFYLRTVQRLFCTISVKIAWSVWYTKINPYMRFSQKGASKCLKSARIARAVF